MGRPIISCGRVAVNLLRAFVPVRNDAVEILADNRVLRRIHDQRQPVLRIAQLAVFLRSSSSLARRSSSSMRLRSLISRMTLRTIVAVRRRDGAEADLDRKFRAIAPPAVEIQT